MPQRMQKCRGQHHFTVSSGTAKPRQSSWYTFGHIRSLVLFFFLNLGFVFACGCFEKKVTLWHKDRGHLLRSLSCDGVLKALAWRPDGSMLASGGFDAAVTVWRSDATSTKQPEEIVWRSKLDSVAAD